MRPHTPLIAVCAIPLLMLGVPGVVPCQESSIAPAAPSLRAGPTRESRAVTARSLADETVPLPSVSLRHDAFRRDFARSFGHPIGENAVADSSGFWKELERWVESQWGGTSFHQWIERSLFLYARVQASTRFERRGFNMDLDMDDVAEGKLGVRVSRSLDPR